MIKSYGDLCADLDRLSANPIEQFDKWFKDAVNNRIFEPNAVTLSTVSNGLYPHVRTVMIKAYDDSGFIFFTDYRSNKVEHIKSNPNVALLFAWLKLERQVKILGVAKEISTVESLRYFSNRTGGIGSWIKEESVLKQRVFLEGELGRTLKKLTHKNIKFSNIFRGYKVVPYSMEFWQGCEDMLYRKFLYLKTDNCWSVEEKSI